MCGYWIRLERGDINENGGVGMPYKVGNVWYISYMFKGERIREPISTKKTEAEAALVARKSDIYRGRFKFQKTKKIRFKVYADEYLENAKTNKKRSWPRDEASLKNLKSHFGEMFLSDVSYKEIEAYKKKRIDAVRITKKGEKKIKPASLSLASLISGRPGSASIQLVRVNKPSLQKYHMWSKLS